MSISIAEKAIFGGATDFVASVVAIDSYQALGNFPMALDLADRMINQATQKELRGLFRYRREIASIVYCMLDIPFTALNIDRIIDRRIKLARTKVFGVKDEFVPIDTYTEFWSRCASRRTAYEYLYESKDISENNALYNLRPWESPDFKRMVGVVMESTSKIRSTLQINAPGFYKHARKDRMVGFSVLAMNQLLRRHFQCIQTGYAGLYVSNVGSSRKSMVSITDIFEVHVPSLAYPAVCGGHIDAGSLSGKSLHENLHVLYWRDIFDVGVKWRQLAEPSDPVYWADMFDDSTGGILEGISTPLLNGAKKVIRYYTYYNDSFDLLKKTMRDGYWAGENREVIISLTEAQKRLVDRATTLSDLYKVTGLEDDDIFVVANCTSAVYHEKVYPCTKFILNPAKSKGEGWDFRISASYTRTAYELYFEDIDVLFKRYVNLVLSSSRDIERQLEYTEDILDVVLDIIYSWVHCTPLTRGSASLAYTSSVALLLAANICIDGDFPKNKQLDWEVLLSTTPSEFKFEVKPWFNNIMRYPISAHCPEIPLQLLDGTSLEYSLEHLLPTPRHVLGALSVNI